MITCGNCNNTFDTYLQLVTHDNCDSIYIDKNIDLLIIKEFNTYLDSLEYTDKIKCGWYFYLSPGQIVMNFTSDKEYLKCLKLFSNVYTNKIPKLKGIYKIFPSIYYNNYKDTDQLSGTLKCLYKYCHKRKNSLINTQIEFLSEILKNQKYAKEIEICLLDKYFEIDWVLKKDVIHIINKLVNKIKILEEKLKIK